MMFFITLEFNMSERKGRNKNKNKMERLIKYINDK
jgi:hypothetical protein